MSYYVNWHDDTKQILLITFGDEVTYPILFQLYEDCANLLDTVSHPVVLVHDLKQLRLVMKIDIATMAKLPRMRIIQHPNWLHSYFANPNARSKIIIDVVNRLFPGMMRKTEVIESVEAAIAAAQTKLATLHA